MRCTDCSRDVKPVVAVDIDGTLGDYHGHFIKFATAYVGHPLPTVFGGNVPFHEALGLELEQYRAVKLAYRQGGMKRSMPLISNNGAERWLIDNLRSQGVEVWLTTTRPFLRLDNVDPDTRAWLERNRIRYDGLLYDEDKYDRLVEIVEPERVIGVLEDLPDLWNRASELGLNPIQRWTWWNRYVQMNPGSERLSAVFRVLWKRSINWKEQHA